jgi:DNA-binding response OmpR family regulator
VSGVRILLAEDDDHIAKLVSFKLAKDGYQLTVARNGQEATDLLVGPKAPAEPWTAVILDVMMPHKDGWQVLRELRGSEKTAKLPVLMLTAKGAQKDITNAAELGAERYLRKPFDPAELAKVVRELVSLQGGGGGDGR